MPEKVKDVRIVMLGKTGTGKSATGNTILGREAFVEDFSSVSVTRQCEKHEGKVDDRNVLVVDTPGLFDTSLSNEKMKAEIVKCVYESVPGPHAFLLVLRLGVKFTEEERNTLKWIQQNFSKDALHYSMVLFTAGDQLKKPIEDYLKNANELRELVKECKGGYHVFKNTEMENRVQVKELLQKIDVMVQRNGGGHYTNETYQEAKRKIREEEREKEKKRMERKERRRREENERRELRKEIEALQRKTELTDHINEIEALQRKTEVTELRKEIKALRSKAGTQSNSGLIGEISKVGSAFGGFFSNAVDGVTDIPSCMFNGVSNAIEELADAADSPGEIVLAGTAAVPYGLWGGVKEGLKQAGRVPKKAFQGLLG